MMTQDEMVRVKSNYQINNLFSSLPRKRGKLTLWQNIDNVHRICSGAIVQKVDLNKEEIEFLPAKGLFKFQSTFPLYFLDRSRILIFKNHIFYNSEYKIVVKLPKTAMLKNKRALIRKDVKSENLFVQYSYGMGRNSNLQELSLKSKLLDFNEQGLAFKSSLSNIVEFVVGGDIKIKSFSDQSKELDGYINYITTVTDSKTMQPYYRVGVKYH